MTPAKVDLRQSRDFGEIFNATFAFVKQNLGVLVKGILFFVAPVAAVSAIFFGRYMAGLFSSLGTLETDPMALVRMVPMFLLGGVFSVVAYVLMQVVVLGVMKLHEVRGPGQFTAPEAFRAGARHFLPILGFSGLLFIGFAATAPVNLIPCLGTIVWIVFLFYAGTRLSLTSAAYVLDDRAFFDGIRASWDVVRPAFWQTFGVLFVTALVAGILGGIFQLPMTIFTQVQMLTSGDPMQAFSAYASPWAVAYLVLATVAQQLLYMLPIVALGLQYGNLSETLTQAGLMDRLSAFDSGAPPAEGTV